MSRPLAFLVVILLTLDAAAQERPAFSPILSFDFGSPLFLNRNPSVLNNADTSVSGTSSNETYGIGLQWLLSNAFSEHWGLQTNVSARYSNGKFVGGRTITGNEWKAVLEATPSWTQDPFNIHIGPWLSTRLSGLVLEDKVDVSGSGTLSPATHVGLLAGAGVRFANFPFEPELHASLDLTEFSRAGTNAYSFGLSLAIPLQSRVVQTTDAFAQEPTSTARPAPSRIRFLVNRSELARTVPLEREELRVKQYTMLDPVIYIDSTAKPPRWQASGLRGFLTGSFNGDSARFSLADKPIPELQQNLLELYASRLKQSPESRLEAKILATGQAEECGNAMSWLLDSVWGVRNQVRISNGTPKTSEADRIAFSSSDPSITAPLVTQWVVQSYHLPHIALSCEVDRDAGGRVTLYRAQPDQSSSPSDESIPFLYTFGHFELGKTLLDGLTSDTIFNLDNNKSWTSGLQHLNPGEPNRIIAELVAMRYNSSDTTPITRYQGSDSVLMRLQYGHFGTSVACDTLFLPPVDTLRAVTTLVRKQFRFYLSDNFKKYDHGSEALELLLSRLSALLTPGVRITISDYLRDKTTSAHMELLRKVDETLGAYAKDAEQTIDFDIHEGLMVTVEL